MPQGEKPKQTGTDGQLRLDTVQILLALKNESKQARYTREQLSRRGWDLYDNNYDWTGKAPWQAKNFVPKLNTSVRNAVTFLKGGLIGPRESFGTKGYGEVGRTMAPYIHKLTKYHMDKSNFVSNYVTSLHAGMIESMVCMKVYPRVARVADPVMSWNRAGPEQPLKKPGFSTVEDILDPEKASGKKKRLEIVYKPVPSMDLYPDPYGEGLYMFHEIDMDLHTFQDVALKNGWDFDLTKLIMDEFADLEKEAREASQHSENLPATPSWRKRIRVDEFYGTIPDGKGGTLFRNCYAVMVNEKWMAVKPRPNELPNYMWPFIYAPIIERPFSIWHQALTDNSLGLQVMMTEFVNFMLDSAQFSMPAFEVDIDQVYDPNDLLGGISPAKVFKKSQNGLRDSPMIRPIQLSSGNNMSFEVVTALAKEFLDAMGMNEFSTPGQRVSKTRTTQGEAAMKSEGSAGFFADIARVQEQKVIEPACEMTYTYLLHYQKYYDFDPVLEEVVGTEEIQKVKMLLTNPNIREMVMGAPLKFTAEGMSKFLSRTQELERLLSTMNVFGNFAKVWPTLLQRIDPNKIAEIVLTSQGIWPEDVYLKGSPSPVPSAPPAPSPGGPPGGAAPEGLPPVSSGTGIDLKGAGSNGFAAPGRT